MDTVEILDSRHFVELARYYVEHARWAESPAKRAEYLRVAQGYRRTAQHLRRPITSRRWVSITDNSGQIYGRAVVRSHRRTQGGYEVQLREVDGERIGEFADGCIYTVAYSRIRMGR